MKAIILTLAILLLSAPALAVMENPDVPGDHWLAVEAGYTFSVDAGDVEAYRLELLAPISWRATARVGYYDNRAGLFWEEPYSGRKHDVAAGAKTLSISIKFYVGGSGP